MLDLAALQLDPEVTARLPDGQEIVRHLTQSRKRTVHDVLREAVRSGTPAVQPRCGVGGHAEMLALLRGLEEGAEPDILTVTIDSHTRLKHFATAAMTLREDPRRLNGYPLVAHGWERGRELNDSVRAPLEVRHGSPDARELFAVAVASGITSFEGGGVTYNLPYAKDVPLARSLRAWQRVDQMCGELAQAGVIVDREFFGSLTAVLVPPSISLAITLLEAMAAAASGVRCLSPAYPQGGQIHQDVAALRSIAELAARYLPADVEVFPVLHQFMGVFPADAGTADALILYGALAGRLGGAAKIINKTSQEAHGIPDLTANVNGVRTSRMAISGFLDFVTLDEERVAEEQYWIQREVSEIVEPVLSGSNLLDDIDTAFRRGQLDIPFSASIHALSQVVPKRDSGGAIRYFDAGRIPLSGASADFNRSRLDMTGDGAGDVFIASIKRDINYFATSGHRRARHISEGERQWTV
ncbi:methylaspartate mutase [Streptomyces sp. NPDC052236]|uniref:methylaspartate mutase n=1 Tax=Streptomyces sp. NPDC052236 TaxID=3365686 RepID=UPI0037D779DE